MGGNCLTVRVMNSLSKEEKYMESITHDRTRRPSSKKMEKIKRKNHDKKYNDDRQYTDISD